jgi:hypothetical protein
VTESYDFDSDFLEKHSDKLSADTYSLILAERDKYIALLMHEEHLNLYQAKHKIKQIFKEVLSSKINQNEIEKLEKKFCAQTTGSALMQMIPNSYRYKDLDDGPMESFSDNENEVENVDFEIEANLPPRIGAQQPSLSKITRDTYAVLTDLEMPKIRTEYTDINCAYRITSVVKGLVRDKKIWEGINDENLTHEIHKTLSTQVPLVLEADPSYLAKIDRSVEGFANERAIELLNFCKGIKCPQALEQALDDGLGISCESQKLVYGKARAVAGGITRVLPKSINGLFGKDDQGEIGMVKASEGNAQAGGRLMWKVKAAMTATDPFLRESEEHRAKKRNQKL